MIAERCKIRARHDSCNAMSREIDGMRDAECRKRASRGGGVSEKRG